MRNKILLTFMLALVLSSCGWRKPAGVPVDSSLAALVPADTMVLAGVRMEALRTTLVYQKWSARIPVADLDKFTKETGLDPRKDVSEMLAFSDGKNLVLLAKGKFPAGQLEALIEKGGARKIPYQGRTLFGSDQSAVVFLNASTVAAGPVVALQRLIDRRGGGVPQKFREPMKSIAPETQIWGVAMGINPMMQKMVPNAGSFGNLGNLGKIIESVENTTFALDLRNGVKVSASGVCRAEQDAKFIHDGMRGLLGMGRLSTPDNQPEMLRFFDAFQVMQQKNAVSVKADIPMDVLEKALERFGQLKRG